MGEIKKMYLASTFILGQGVYQYGYEEGDPVPLTVV